MGSRRLYYDRQSYDNVNVIPSLFVFSAAPTSHQHPPATLLLLLRSIHHPISSSIIINSSPFVILLFSKNPLKEKKWYHVRTYACVTKKAPSLLLSIPLFRFFFCRVCLAYRFLWDVYSLSSCRFRTFCLFAFEPFVPKRLFSFFLRPATSII